jgi:hypothetical protein
MTSEVTMRAGARSTDRSRPPARPPTPAPAAAVANLACLAAAVMLLAAVPGTAGGCADFSRGDPGPGAGGAGGGGGALDGGPGDGGAGASFAANVHPLLMDACASCHEAGGEAADTSLLLTGQAAADYPAVMALVDIADPVASRLLTKASGRGHQGGNIFAAGSSGYTVLLGWIQGGAPP